MGQIFLEIMWRYRATGVGAAGVILTTLEVYAGRVDKCGLRDTQPAGFCGSKCLNI